jgi:hypothetical protein
VWRVWCGWLWIAVVVVVSLLLAALRLSRMSIE